MRINKNNMTEEQKKERIFQEYLRIGTFFEGIESNQFAMLFPLIRNAAFMRVTLDELQELINQAGPVEEYRNGETQYGQKASAAMQSYNSLIRNYSATIKALFDRLPKERKIGSAEQFRRSRMDEDELAELLAEEEAEKERSAAAWMEKLKRAYDNGGEVL